MGEISGYLIGEGSELEIANQLQQYAPFVQFMVHPILSVIQVEEMIKSLMR